MSAAELERGGSQVLYELIMSEAEEEQGRVALLGLDAPEEGPDEFLEIINQGMPEED